MGTKFRSESRSCLKAAFGVVCAFVPGLVAGCGGGGSSEAAATPPERPNILLIVGDDLGLDVLSASGAIEQTAITPNLDALAAGGVTFSQVWSNPVCSPSRASIQTGRYAFRTGIGQLVRQNSRALRIAERTLPEVLDEGTDGAYAHAAIGKWHLGNDSVGGPLAANIAGYQHFAGTLRSIAFPDSYMDWEEVVDGVAQRFEGYATTRTADQFLDWVVQVEDPWFAYVAFNAPHPPLHVPPEELFTRELGADPSSREVYLAMVEALDTEIGRMLAGLDPAERENTIVMFVSDNGTPAVGTVAPFVPEQAKATLFEGGVRVPLIIAGPGVASGATCDALVSVADLHATVAELAGVELDSLAESIELDALSLVPYLESPERPSMRSYLFSELYRPNGEPTPDWAPPCEGVVVAGGCHEDVGFAGPGVTQLELCWTEEGGSPFEPTVTIRGGPPGAEGIVWASDVSRPTPLFGGTLVPFPNPFLTTYPFTFDAAGRASFELRVDNGIEALFYQALVEDPAQPGGFAFSNAVRGRFPDHGIAVRDARYKLIVDVRTCASAFFDLESDPFEMSNLLEGALAGEALVSFEALEGILRSLEPGTEPALLTE